jgi:hypothetical protein
LGLLGLTVTVVLLVAPAAAQVAAVPPAAQAAMVICASTPAQRQHCPADTSAGVALVRVTGSGACLLGKTWGYDDKGVWVSDGCGGEFVLGQAAPGGPPAGAAQPAAPKQPPPERIESWGEFEPGQGFLIGRSGAGELEISAYALIRYINQMPGTQTFTDHLGIERTVDGRNDLYRTGSWSSSRVAPALETHLQHLLLDND